MSSIITVRQQVYEIIKRRLADGTYGHGQKLQEIEVAQDLKVSRSPVREAFKQLEAEGLLDAVPNKGVYVRSFTPKEISDIFDLRDLYEGHALDLMSRSFTPELRRKLERQRELTVEMYGDKDYLMEPTVNFHYTLVESTGNSFLIASHNMASAITMSYHDILFAGQHYQENVDAHLAVIDALLADDFELARAELKRHLSESKEIICRGMAESGEQQRAGSDGGSAEGDDELYGGAGLRSELVAKQNLRNL